MGRRPTLRDSLERHCLLHSLFATPPVHTSSCDEFGWVFLWQVMQRRRVHLILESIYARAQPLHPACSAASVCCCQCAGMAQVQQCTTGGRWAA